MASMQEAKKIGEVNFQDYKTEFLVMPKVEEYLNNNDTSLACLLPEGWFWYEVMLFDAIDVGDGIVDYSSYGKEFKVIYTGIVESKDYSEGELSESGFNDKPEDAGEIILESKTMIKDIHVKYMLIENKKSI